MKIVLAMVLSVDGKSTKWDMPDQSWASPDDKIHLTKLVSENNLILMGGKTYDTAKAHIKPKEGKLRMVVTRDPEKYSQDRIEEQLEFSNKPLEELVTDLEKRGFKQMLLLSGEGLNKELFEKKLINEIAITLEPKIFGLGRSMAAESKLDINLKLKSFEKVNENGTLILNYDVLYQ